MSGYEKSAAGIASAKAEIRRQLSQAYALVSSAKNSIDADKEPTAVTLLDMAEDVLGDLEYINRLDPPGKAPR